MRSLSAVKPPSSFCHPPILLFVFFFLPVLGLFAATPETAPPPNLWVLGDSTAHNSGRGRNGRPVAGWGTPLADYFDPARLTVRNVAHAGQSSRTYFTNPNDWPRVEPLIRPGDYVLLVFGINDGGPPTSYRSRARQRILELLTREPGRRRNRATDRLKPAAVRLKPDDDCHGSD